MLLSLFSLAGWLAGCVCVCGMNALSLSLSLTPFNSTLFYLPPPPPPHPIVTCATDIFHLFPKNKGGKLLSAAFGGKRERGDHVL